AIAVATIAVRWITTAPHRATLATGRIAGLGAATLIAAAAFVPAAGPTLDARTALAGGCLAAGAATLLGLLPLGGWAAASTGLVRGADVAPWALLVAPTVLLGALALFPALPAGARNPFANVLLVMGLLSAVWGGLMALRTPEPARYGRLLLGLVASAALTGTAARALAGGWRPLDALPAPLVTRMLAWAVALGLLVLGLAPGWLTVQVFGPAVSG